jgi:hypothetical protein
VSFVRPLEAMDAHECPWLLGLYEFIIAVEPPCRFPNHSSTTMYHWTSSTYSRKSIQNHAHSVTTYDVPHGNQLFRFSLISPRARIISVLYLLGYWYA